MNLNEIEEKVSRLDLTKGFDLVYELLTAYGLPRSSITRLRNGSYDQLDSELEHLWKGKLYYRFVEFDEDLHSLIDSAQNDETIARYKPRFLLVRNRTHLLAIDTRTKSTLDIPIEELAANTSFFLPWAGIEKVEVENTNHDDVKAAKKMARLYDEINKHNAIESDQHVRNLNVFFSRLLFCFFAQDTEVFQKKSFTNAVGSLTKTDGTDTAKFLEDLFVVLNTEMVERKNLPRYFTEFGYVNGSLFATPLPVPSFTSKARETLLDCGTLDWSKINPDIFGSMIQAVVRPSQREGLGMHYTSVENIMRVIRPLFLDDLHLRLNNAKTINKLQHLLDDICGIKVFDPACGSGNFLVVAYKELRRLEHRILQQMADLDPSKRSLFKLSGIKLEHFYGIEIDDFAHEMATLSLWLAKHQMNLEFEELFGVEISLIPLRDTGKIVRDNATQVDWEAVCPSDVDGNVFILGNPPYLGANIQGSEHKADFESYFGTAHYDRYLDYISLWFLKGADYIQNNGASLGFVSTNSICQGANVALLWPALFEKDIEISFARKSFPWSNNAKGKAGVNCIIVGLSQPNSKPKALFEDKMERHPQRISPYLLATDNDTIVHKSKVAISQRPAMGFGSMPRDGGALSLTKLERDKLLDDYPDSAKFVRPYLGASEFIRGVQRFCIWINDNEAAQAQKIPPISARLHQVEIFRNGSKAQSTKQLAHEPHRFVQRAYQETQAIVVPRVSSQRREYIPMGFLPAGTVASDQLYAVYGAEPWLFGLLQSRMHMAWLEVVGGRMKSDYRYSNSLVYNTFPFPEMETPEQSCIADLAFSVLECRERFPDRTLADLYDPDKMPKALKKTHQSLDDYVDSLYRKRPFNSDAERVELLLSLYEAATRTQELAHA